MASRAGAVRFEKTVREVYLRSPLRGFGLERRVVELRREPLLGILSRISVERAARPKPRVDEGQAEGECPFCPGRLESETPLFPSDLVPGGRIRRGGATVFPNLYPFARHHAVVVLSAGHTPRLSELSHGVVADGLAAALDYIRIIAERDPRAVYCSVGWNHLPGAGASILHPHMQVIVDEEPTWYISRSLEASAAYYAREGRSYWWDLVEAEEALGERFIARTGGFTWLASFAPLGNNEVLGVGRYSSSLLELGDDELLDLSRGLSAILRGLGDMGLVSFNASIYSAPLGLEPRHYALHVRLISRPGPSTQYTADAGFMERLQLEPVIETVPEETARRIREAIYRSPNNI